MLAPPSGSDRQTSSASTSFVARTLAGPELKVPEDFRGRLVLLDFWATWCTPCRAEVPHLRKAFEQFGDKGLTILGVSLDGPGTPAKRVEGFVAEQKMSWPQVYDDAATLARKFGVTGIPAAFLIDGNTGKVVAEGDELRGEKLVETIARNLPTTKQQGS